VSRQLLAHISDSHFDQHADVEDLVGVHRSFVDAAKSAHVDAIAHAGDFFEGISTPRERNMLADWLGACAEVAPVFGVKGNHDRALELDLFSLLRSANGRVMIVDRPQTSFLGGFGFIGLPWFDKAPIASDSSSGKSRIATQESARALLIGLGAWAAEARDLASIPVLVAHAMVGGSIVSTGQMILGQTVEVSPTDLLSCQAEAVLLGHVHKFQEWAGGRVAYSGSPRRSDHGEPEPKGWRLLVFEDGKFAGAEFVKLPARELYHADFDFTGENRGLMHTPIVLEQMKEHCRGARVRVRYRIATRDLALFDKEALRRNLMLAGAHDVKIEAQPVAEDRTRAVEVVTASTLPEKVAAFLTAKGITTPRWSSIEAKLGEIESEVAQ
jgi:DNA repair exonuclease SbcCD nuclease subunit